MNIKVKKILNFSEYKTNRILESFLMNYEAKVNAKMRVADILPIENSGISNELYSYALKSHFDFIVTQSLLPVFAIEFDGMGHDDLNDKKKDQLCKKFDFPILRVTESAWRNIQDGHMTMLQYICEVFFTYEWFKEEKSKGNFNADEPFILASMIEIPHIERRFPLAPGVTSTRQKIHKLFGKDLGGNSARKVFVPTSFVLKNRDSGNDQFFSIIYIQLNDISGILYTTKMKSTNLFDDIVHADFTENLAMLNFESIIDDYIKNPEAVRKTKSEIMQELRTIDDKFGLSKWSGVLGSSGESDEVIDLISKISFGRES
jgi:hypothetical protein